MLEQAVEDNGWPFERSARDEINLTVSGRWCDYHFCFTWREDLQALHVSAGFEMRVSKERRAEIAELLLTINSQLWLGHFDLWSEDGTVLFRHVLIFPDSRVSAAQCEALLATRRRSLRALLSGIPVCALGRKNGPAGARCGHSGMRRPGVSAPPSRSDIRRDPPSPAFSRTSPVNGGGEASRISPPTNG